MLPVRLFLKTSSVQGGNTKHFGAHLFLTSNATCLLRMLRMSHCLLACSTSTSRCRAAAVASTASVEDMVAGHQHAAWSSSPAAYVLQTPQMLQQLQTDGTCPGQKRLLPQCLLVLETCVLRT